MKTDTQQQTKHTPGPWIVEDDKRDDYMMTIRSSGAGRLGVAYCAKDDARLIAAAPELLAALRRALPLIEWHDGRSDRHDEIIDAAYAAIEKAEGRA